MWDAVPCTASSAPPPAGWLGFGRNQSAHVTHASGRGTRSIKARGGPHVLYIHINRVRFETGDKACACLSGVGPRRRLGVSIGIGLQETPPPLWAAMASDAQQSAAWEAGLGITLSVAGSLASAVGLALIKYVAARLGIVPSIGFGAATTRRRAALEPARRARLLDLPRGLVEPLRRYGHSVRGEPVLRGTRASMGPDGPHPIPSPCWPRDRAGLRPEPAFRPDTGH